MQSAYEQREIVTAPRLTVSEQIDAAAALDRAHEAAKRMGAACKNLQEVADELIRQNQLGKSRIDAQIERMEAIVRDARIKADQIDAETVAADSIMLSAACSK